MIDFLFFEVILVGDATVIKLPDAPNYGRLPRIGYQATVSPAMPKAHVDALTRFTEFGCQRRLREVNGWFG